MLRRGGGGRGCRQCSRSTSTPFQQPLREPVELSPGRRDQETMTMETKRTASRAAAATLAAFVSIGGPASAHHSFSIYDSSVTKVCTGVVTRVNPDANHLQIFFAPMNDERKNVLRDENGQPIIWAVEMVGSAQAARQDITVSSFPAG